MPPKETISDVLKIGPRIKLLRKLLGLTQSEFAILIGLETHMAVYQYEKNLNKPSYKRLEIISEKCGVSIRWLLVGAVDENKCRRLMRSVLQCGKPIANVAERLGVSPAFFDVVQTGGIDPSVDIIRRFCRLCDVDTVLFADLFVQEATLLHDIRLHVRFDQQLPAESIWIELASMTEWCKSLKPKIDQQIQRETNGSVIMDVLTRTSEFLADTLIESEKIAQALRPLITTVGPWK